MIERDKEYYNHKISELYAVIENQEKIIRDLQEKNESLKTRIKTVKRRRKKQTQKKYKYKTRIDKAIKYIKENQKEYGNLLDNEKIILGILKGGNND